MSSTPANTRRGPSGRAPPPPPWLGRTDLPIDIVPAGTPLHRVHRLRNNAIFFGPGAGVPATYRFDSPSSAFGVLYVGLDLSAALVETLLRNPARRMVAYAEVASRATSEIRCGRDLRVVPMHGAGLQQLGCDNAISTGPYQPCGAWADALWAHGCAPDAIAYRSRHDPTAICLALFERVSRDLSATPPVRLLDQIPTVARVLGAYRKSITSPPI